MKAGCYQLKLALLVVVFNVCFYGSYVATELQVCKLCSGAVLNVTAVGQFCSASAGRIDGRCCFTNDNTSDPEHIIGLDLSNCSLTHVEDLHEASAAIIIDLSLNPVVNVSASAFQGFVKLNHLILPPDVVCPGGNASWEQTGITQGVRLCQGQKNMCNQTGQLSISCPEASLCAPYGPGSYECSCVGNYHGYKCLRQGEFPALQVFGPLAATTLLISVLLWVTQRRKAKSL